jgi:hypothetical protein
MIEMVINVNATEKTVTVFDIFYYPPMMYITVRLEPEPSGQEQEPHRVTAPAPPK